MKKLIISLFLLCLIVLNGCVTPGYMVSTKTDEFEGYTTIDLQSNELPDKDMWNLLSVSINKWNFGIRKFISKSGEISYLIKLLYFGDGWVFIDSGQSLHILADDNHINLSGEGSFKNRDVVYGDIVSETAFYPIKKAQIKKIADAATVKIKVDGQEGYVTAEFGAENIEQVKKFYIENIVTQKEILNAISSK